MLIQRIKLKNVLSFGPNGQELELKPLNVLIGPNGSGKSNLIEAIALLQAAPKELVTPILEGGGSADWLWRGEPTASSGAIEIVFSGSDQREPLRYRLAFAAPDQQFRLIDERLESEPGGLESQPRVYVDSDGVEASVIRCDRGSKEDLDAVRIGPMNAQQSILTHLRDPEIYPQRELYTLLPKPAPDLNLNRRPGPGKTMVKQNSSSSTVTLRTLKADSPTVRRRRQGDAIILGRGSRVRGTLPACCKGCCRSGWLRWCCSSWVC